MKRFDRALIRSHCAEDGQLAPSFIGSVALGESFILETEDSNDANGPLAVEGVRAGEAIAVEIEGIEIVGPVMAPNGGPLDGLEGFELELRDEYLHFPEGFRIRPRPTLGNVAVLPSPDERERIIAWARGIGYTPTRWRQLVNDPRGRHCHQDCPFLGPGSRIHLRAQVDGAGLCMADFHAYMGEGETAFNGVSAAAGVTARVTRCTDWLVDWPLVETADEIMVVRTGSDYVQVVREAFRGCRELVQARTGCSLQLANALVASVMDLRNCAIYGLGHGYFEDRPDEPSRDLSVVGALPKCVLSRRADAQGSSPGMQPTALRAAADAGFA
ncbi:MAG: hypothetical protein AB1505_03560 [Candidatus Latescibacterota bacterium]